MDFELTEEQEIFRESFRKFLEAEIQPLDDRFGDEEMTAERARELSKMLIPWGFLGGEGDSEVERDTTIRCVQTEELSRVFPGLSGITGMTAGCAAGIAAGAHPEVAARLVEPLRRGELIGSNAISEPNVGSDASAIECRAEKRGDRWVVNGTKCWISNGHIADVTLALLQTDPSQGPAGLRHFVIDRRESPFESRETPTLGLKSFPTSELYFRDLEVPDINRIGTWTESSGSEDSGKAFRRFLTGVAGARAGAGLMSVGIAQRAFDIAFDYVQQRKQFGKEIARFQLVSAMIAEMATEIDAARLLCHRAFHALRKGRADVDASMAKWYGTEMGVRVTSTAIQCMGSNGLASENRVERCLRDARMLTMPDGTTQIQKLIIGRALTGMSAIR
jgi:alkylation response protein AidB-like acyl-CoA dehydrogenase